MLRLLTFRAQMLWLLIPTLLFSFLTLGLVDLYQQQRLAEEEIGARARSMAENLAYSSRLAVVTEDRRLLDAALQSVSEAVDFAYVSIYNEKWKPLAHALGKRVDRAKLKPGLDEIYHSLHFQEAGNVVRKISTDYVEYIVPVISVRSTIPFELQIGDGETSRDARQTRERIIGAVRLGLSTNRMNSLVSSFLKWRGWTLFVVLGLSTLAIYLFSGRITRPIKQLTDQARQMRRGTLTQSISIDSPVEIGQLAANFNEMARSLNELYTGLERKVAERTEELRTANVMLAEVSEQKSRFLANVNHELRTPLSSIIGYARLLRRETEGQISSLQRENLEDLLHNAERLLGMIDSLLDLAKIEAGKIEVHIEPVKIDELIQRATATIEPMLNKGAVRLVRDIPPNMPPLYGDPEILRQVILNLLGNAVKFTDRGEIRISACQQNGNFKLAVADSGIGIAEAELQRIFEEFDRGRLTNDGSYRGTGLGLAIVKRLVEVLGGAVAVESEVGKGSTFTVNLPAHRDQIAPA